MEKSVDKVHSYTINGISLQTGDIICTTNGDDAFLAGEVWKLVGKLLPGDVDHIALYVGPDGRCVEAGPKKKVVTFNVQNNKWDSRLMGEERNFYDTFYGVSRPLEKRNLSEDEEAKVRISIANYCLDQANAEKPYNMNFLDSENEETFYCSQLAYKAYQKHGVNLNTGIGIPSLPGTESIIVPQEIWSGFPTVKATPPAFLTRFLKYFYKIFNKSGE